MRKWIAVLLCALLLCGCSQPAEEPTPTEPQPALELEPLCDGKSLKILAMGNSFSNNATEHLYDIAIAEGMTDVTLGRLYIGSCTLQMHAENATGDLPNYTYYKNTIGLWEKTEDVTMLHGLLDEDWDIITLQQSSATSGQPASFDGHLETLIDYVNQNKTNPDAKLVWHMTWAYQGDSQQKAFSDYGRSQDRMYKAIMDTAQEKVLPNAAFTALIPAGTAVQNARTSFMGDTLTEDGYHLNKMGKLIASYCWYATLTGKALDTVSLNFIPGLSLTDNDKAVIIESVNNALLTPFAVTNSTHTA